MGWHCSWILKRMAPTISSDSERTKGGACRFSDAAHCGDYGFLSGWSYAGAAIPDRRSPMLPARASQPTAPNWKALLGSILLVAPFLRALWQAMQTADATWLPAN